MSLLSYSLPHPDRWWILRPCDSVEEPRPRPPAYARTPGLSRTCVQYSNFITITFSAFHAQSTYDACCFCPMSLGCYIAWNRDATEYDTRYQLPHDTLSRYYITDAPLQVSAWDIAGQGASCWPLRRRSRQDIDAAASGTSETAKYWFRRHITPDTCRHFMPPQYDSERRFINLLTYIIVNNSN